MDIEQDLGIINDDSYLFDDGCCSQAPSTLERATLTRKETNKRNVSPIRNSWQNERITKLDAGNPGESSAFWALIGVMLLLAAGNLILTFFAMGVLRLGTGMESVEFHPLTKATNFFGLTDLGSVHKKDGIILGFSDAPFSVVGKNSKVSLSLHTKKAAPQIEIGPSKTEIRNIKEFKVIEPTSGRNIFTTKNPNFGLPNGVQNLNVKRSTTARITSPTFSDLDIQSDTTIRLKGTEGLDLQGRQIKWSADQDIYLNTLNGSIVLAGGSGLYVEVNTLPLAKGPVDQTKDRGQYKLCVCLPKGQLFRVPVPNDNNQREPAHQINCASFTNPCINKSY